MSTMTLEHKDGIHVLTLTNNENENQLTQDVANEYLQAFETIEKYKGKTALLITCEAPKTFSTGINLQWLMKQNYDGQKKFVNTLEQVFYRLALLNAPTVICMNGNTYAGAAVLACCGDFRVMRADRGRFCFPEVNIKIPFTPMMMDVIKMLPNQHALKHMALVGTAYTGQQCKEFNLVDEIYPLEDLQQKALELAKLLATKDRTTYTSIKLGLRADLLKHKDSIFTD